MQYREFDERKV